jgi:hypothetical protein
LSNITNFCGEAAILKEKPAERPTFTPLKAINLASQYQVAGSTFHHAGQVEITSERAALSKLVLPGPGGFPSGHRFLPRRPPAVSMDRP